MTRLVQDFHIELGKETIALRPTLREALRLETQLGGISRLLADVQSGSLTAAIEIIKPFYCPAHLPSLVLDHLDDVQPTLYNYVLALTGIDLEQKPDPKAEGKDLSLQEHFENLFRYGTGWIGWTPEETLDASPYQIIEAYKGHIDMLKAIHGSSETTDKTPDGAELDDKLKKAFTVFATRKYASKQKRKKKRAA